MKRLVSMIVSLLLLAVIYSRIEVKGLLSVLKNCDWPWLAASLSMVVPFNLLTAWRLQQLLPKDARLGFGEANRLILATSVLNMILPSKMGDLAKVFFLKRHGNLSGSLSLSLVVFEKACDMLSLLLWCVFGLLVYSKRDFLFGSITAAVAAGLLSGFFLIASPGFTHFLLGRVLKKAAPQKFSARLERFQSAWDEMHRYFWSDKKRLMRVSATSVFLWFLHLLQIWFFIFTLRANAPWVANLALAPLAILAGLLPFTFAGIGTRDAALLIFYQPFLDPHTAAGLGLLCTSRYLLPALVGLPLVGRYLGRARELYFSGKGQGLFSS